MTTNKQPDNENSIHENNRSPRRLWLDDTRPAPEGWVRVKTYDAAIASLIMTAWDEVSLDHDLGTKADIKTDDAGKKIYTEWYDGEEKTGYHVALWMVENGVFPPQVWIHSMNPVGAESMRQLLCNHHPGGAGAVKRRLP